MHASKHNIRFVTATSLFDGHDASINIFRRIIQDSGAEVIHLGHNRSAYEIIQTALEEDANAIAVTSYQGGHIEFFKYMYDLLKENKSEYINIFGGGGGVIVPYEIKELQEYGICKIFSPKDGMQMGLTGMVDYMLEQSDFLTFDEEKLEEYLQSLPKTLPKAISLVEKLITQDSWTPYHEEVFQKYFEKLSKDTKVLGFTGSGGAGKSSLIDELLRRFLNNYQDKKIGILAVDPTKKSKGALLGDRIRMNSLPHKNAYMRSMATRSSNMSISKATRKVIDLYKMSGFDLIILETAGVGQSDIAVIDIADYNVYVMTPEYGAALQLEKINMLDYADVVVLNKYDKESAEDALYEVRKQYMRNHKLFDKKLEEMPVYHTVASNFNDAGANYLFYKLMQLVGIESQKVFEPISDASVNFLIPPQRTRYLSEIVSTIMDYKTRTNEQIRLSSNLYALEGAKKLLQLQLNTSIEPSEEADFVDTKIDESLKKENLEKALNVITQEIQQINVLLDTQTIRLIENWNNLREIYAKDYLISKIRDKEIKYELTTKTLSGNKIPKISLPKSNDYGEIVKFQLLENVPGKFPFTAGTFPLKRQDEKPTRMFAGEGTPERTNKRFHYLSTGQPFSRLSTAFDSIALYGQDPDMRPDIYGKIGNAGVSIATVDDAKKLYSGFNLCDPNTSVSMTINGPAPMMLAMFFNTAIDQQVEKYLKDNNKWGQAQDKINNYYKKLNVERPVYNNSFGIKDADENHLGLGLLGISGDLVVDIATYDQIKKYTLNVVRGTVQADILKEDQAQNTCLFSTDFSLKLMGDIQKYFIDNVVKNYYSVSISGYHIAEAGANPITQLAFTLANGFTYIEYYLARGMNIDDFAPNLSFFFSNGLDIEYSVIGRVARRIWAIAMKNKYSANERSQKLKYHIQTSGRSLHAMEIAFNDIRTTLQALTAIYDNCNSLHTNAYDEAITTPTEESVRRALAIQMIINNEFGMTKNENPLQGCYIIEELTNLVEEEVLNEFERLSKRGGVLGAMESRYQRNKIQEESLYYEELKNTGELPIIGVNTFVSDNYIQEEKIELSRSTEEEKKWQLDNLIAFQKRNGAFSKQYLDKLRYVAQTGGNIFEELMETVKYASLGQITNALFEVGGKYRRNM
ncbi:B12 binding domain / kinase domain / Methylmalonyl-CoA mutase [Desulfurella amilsii]|uniref:Fused isobutyryl-CoA mutase n=1 Tax=Desulfurella amilsii TaxID=1562698 RepID=A0A1X4XVH4_9BACT|nr:methylmalonyl-CoA mutase family protein [Desulfurella amilsii]OSS41524.1 B12 binding domain / kinase domain / Methylmalonyl-CoA mutase [Desulfurella amilsii]